MSVVKVRDIPYSDGRAALRGNLYYRSDLEGSCPAVLVLPAYRGPQANEEKHAIRLAEEGYAAFVVDVYGRRDQQHGRLWNLIRCGWYQLRFRIYQRRVWAAYDKLREQPEADVSRLGMIGFCAGGVGVLIMLRCMPELKAAGIFHMGPSRFSPPERGAQKAVTQVHHGALDRVARLSFVKRRIIKRWNRAGTVLRLKEYPQAGHAFTDEDLHQGPAMGHHQAAAQQAWQDLLLLFRNRLLNAAAVPNQPAVNPAARKRRFDVALFHGMGLQNRYMTLDELVNFLVKSLCDRPDEVLYGNKAILQPQLVTQRNRRDRQVVLRLKRALLHPAVQAGMGQHAELEIHASEVYWAPIASGTARARKTIMWLIGGLSSITRAAVSLPLSRGRNGSGRPGGRPDGKPQKKRGRCERDDYGQLDSPNDVWRLAWLLVRLALVIVVLPLAAMSVSALVVGWLAVMAFVLGGSLPMPEWLQMHWQGWRWLIDNPKGLSGSPLLDIMHWLSMLAILLPVALNHVGSSILANSVNTPLSRQDQQERASYGLDRIWLWLLYLGFAWLAHLIVASGFHGHWQQLQTVLKAGPGSAVFPHMAAWAWAAVSLPLLSLGWLMGFMGWRLLKNEVGLPRMLGYGAGLLAIALALRGAFVFGSIEAMLAVLLIMLVTWVSLIRRGLLFIREYLGDVAAFVSTNENDRMFELRSRILQLSEENLERLFGYDLAPNPANRAHQHSELQRQKGQDLIVMAHSLGTVVAYQALCRYFERLHEIDKLQLDGDKARTHGSRWMTREMQRRLRLFVTFGCPLDTINMSFNALHSGKPVFDRVVSEAYYRHGCSGPFKHCRWLNWWHGGDVVSAKVLWQAGDKGPVNRLLPLGAAPVVNHSSYLLAKAVQEDFRREFARLL